MKQQRKIDTGWTNLRIVIAPVLISIGIWPELIWIVGQEWKRRRKREEGRGREDVNTINGINSCLTRKELCEFSSIQRRLILSLMHWWLPIASSRRSGDNFTREDPNPIAAGFKTKQAIFICWVIKIWRGMSSQLKRCSSTNSGINHFATKN